MIKIKEIKVENYKNIGKAELSFSNFNVITGANNSGKSNFLQILSFLDFIINGAADEVELAFIKNDFPSPFDMINKPIQDFTVSKSEIISISIIFSDLDREINYTYYISFKFEKETEKILTESEILEENFQSKNIHKTGKPATIFKRLGEKLTLSSYYKKNIGVKRVSKYTSVLRLLKILPPQKQDSPYDNALDALDTVLKTPIFYFSNLELSKPIGTERQFVFNGRTTAIDLDTEIADLEKTEKWKLFKEAILSVLGIDSVEMVELINLVKMDENWSKKYKVCIVHHLNQRKRINNLSDGSLLLIALIVKILSSDQSIFLIEEPENSLHPKALSRLVEFMRSFEDEKQFIITSHSVVLINMVKPEEVIVAKVNEEGTSELVNIENVKELRRKLKSGYLDFSDYIFFDTESSDEEVSVY